MNKPFTALSTILVTLSIIQPVFAETKEIYPPVFPHYVLTHDGAGLAYDLCNPKMQLRKSVTIRDKFLNQEIKLQDEVAADSIRLEQFEYPSWSELVAKNGARLMADSRTIRFNMDNPHVRNAHNEATQGTTLRTREKGFSLIYHPKSYVETIFREATKLGLDLTTTKYDSEFIETVYQAICLYGLNEKGNELNVKAEFKRKWDEKAPAQDMILSLTGQFNRDVYLKKYRQDMDRIQFEKGLQSSNSEIPKHIQDHADRSDAILSGQLVSYSTSDETKIRLLKRLMESLNDEKLRSQIEMLFPID